MENKSEEIFQFMLLIIRILLTGNLQWPVMVNICLLI